MPAKRPSVIRRFGFKLLMLTLLVIALSANIYYNYSAHLTSRADYMHAKEALSKDPREAERLAELAINGAGGRYPEAQLLLCRAYGLTGEWDAAFGCFSLIRDFRTCDPIELVELGNEAYQAGAWQLAEDSLTASVSKLGPHSARARELLVRLDLRFHRTEEALNRCREWQIADPEAALPWAISGDIKTGMINLGAAIHEYRQALQRSLSPQLQAETRSSLAQLLIHTGDSAGARAEFDKLLSQGPLTGKLLLSHSQLLRTEGRNEEALAELNRHITDRGTSPEALKQRGIIHLDEGHLNEALTDLKASVKANPFDIAAQHKLAQAYVQSGDPAAAQPHFEASRKMTEATYRRGDVEAKLSSDPTNSELKQELAAIRAILGR